MLSILFGKREQLMHECGMLYMPEAVFELEFKWEWLDENWIRHELVHVERFPEGEEPRKVLFDRGLTHIQLAGGTHTPSYLPGTWTSC